jgi:hypothetical protein
VKPYHRAPHVLLGFPTRYVERGWSESMRRCRNASTANGAQRPATATAWSITEGLFMASRDGVTFKRWNDAFLPPGIERPGTWNYGQQYIAWHLVETKSALEGAPNELSLYAPKTTGPAPAASCAATRCASTAFVSIHAPMSGGELITKPLTFTGKTLTMNFATSAAGGVKVEIQDANGKPMPGFALSDSPKSTSETPSCAPWCGKAAPMSARSPGSP